MGMMVILVLIISDTQSERKVSPALESVPNNSLVDGSKTTGLYVVLCVPVEPRNHWKLLLNTELSGNLDNSVTIGCHIISRIPTSAVNAELDLLVAQLLKPPFVLFSH